MKKMKNIVLHKALIASAFAACASVFASDAQVPVIHGNIVGPAEWVDYTSGIYSFPAESPLQLTLQKESRFISVNGGGDVVNGIYHYISDNDGLGSSYNYRMYLYDAATWIPKDNFRVPDNWSATDLSHDPATGRLYGCFTQNRSTWHFGWMNPSDATFHEVASAGGGYPVVASNRFGAIYAIDYQGNLLAVNKADGTAEVMFATGLQPEGMQTGCFDPESDILYWCFRDAENHTALYAIDLAAGADGVSLVSAFPMDEIVTGAYIDPVSPDVSVAPEAVGNLEAVSAGEDVTVSFTLPSAAINGMPLPSSEVEYMVLVDGIMPQQRTLAAAGDEVRLGYTLADGEHMVTVAAFCNGEAGLLATQRFFVGPDTPQPVSSVAATRSGDTFIATWAPPVGGANGGSINPDAIRYEVKFFTGNTSETHTVAEPRFEQIVDISYAANCRVEITAVDGQLRSEAVASAPVMMGKGYAIPYAASFDNGAGVADFLMDDVNGDGSTWYYEPIYEDMRTDYKLNDGKMDDWLYTPILNLDNGYFYHLQFGARTAGVSYEERMEVKAGLLRTPADMSVEVIPEATYVSTSFVTTDGYFTIPESGNWHVGFHSVTEGTSFYISIDDIKIERGGLMTAPAKVSDVKATPAAAGVLQCEIAFTTPVLTLDGDPIDENMKVEVRRSGRKLKEFTDVQPGAALVASAVPGVQGVNKYEIVCSNGDGFGIPVAVSVYLGEDKPLPPENVKVSFVKGGIPVVTWDAPSGGVNGGVLNESKLTYSVRRGFDKQYILQNSREKSVTDTHGLDVVEQAIMYYEVYATNGAGTSERAESQHFVMGTPYQMPYFESFKDMQEMRGPWLGLLIDNPQGAWYIDSEGARPSCEPVDGNGGLVTFAPGNEPHTSTIASPLVCIDDAEYPVLEFYFYCTRENESRLNIGVRTEQTEYEVIRGFDVCDQSFQPGWNLVRIPLDDYKGEGYVQVYFTGENGCVYGNNRIHLDCIGISDIPRFDVAAVALDTPDIIVPGKEATFMATVENTGIEQVDDITVTLLRDGEPVSTNAIPSLPYLGKLVVALTDMPDLSFPEIVSYSFEVSAGKDGNSANDLSAAHPVTVELPHYPVPALRGYVDGTDAVLEWDAPATAGVRAPCRDGFEDYTPFAIDNVGDWTLTDIDGAAGTTGILDGEGNPIEYDNSGKPMAYQVFNPGMLGFPMVDEDGQRSMYAAHGGQQMMCAFCDLDAYNDDWLISPLLPGDAQTIEFYAKSYTGYYGLESFVVMVSDGGTGTAEFKEITEIVSAPKDWTLFKFELPQGTRHFAIRCVSVDQFALCIDDVKFIPDSSEPVDLRLEGYNIYLDNSLVRTAAPGDNTCRIPVDAGNQTPKFRISAVYHLGESAYSPVVELDMSSVTAVMSGSELCEARAMNGGLRITQPQASSASVYTAAGNRVAYVHGDASLPLPAGIYLVKFPAKTVKVAVR